MFIKATKKQSKLRLALEGASGSGKTYSSLILAQSLGKKIAVIDTEHGSASLYSDKFNFDVMELNPPYEPERYIEAIKLAEKLGYEVLVIDSISHEWNGEGGCLDICTKIGGNSYTAWAKVTPRHDRFINSILQSNMHIIATMRSKANYETGKDDKTGKMTVQKKGTAPIQRDSVEYEFTIVFDLNQNHIATVSKDRSGLFDGKDFDITNQTGEKLLNWLNTGDVVLIPQKPKIEEIKVDLTDYNEFVEVLQKRCENKQSQEDKDKEFERLVAKYTNKTADIVQLHKNPLWAKKALEKAKNDDDYLFENKYTLDDAIDF